MQEATGPSGKFRSIGFEIPRILYRKTLLKNMSSSGRRRKAAWHPEARGESRERRRAAAENAMK
jgi:hypothetical protein